MGLGAPMSNREIADRPRRLTELFSRWRAGASASRHPRGPTMASSPTSLNKRRLRD